MKSQSILLGLAAAFLSTPILAATTATSASPSSTGGLSNLPSGEPYIGQITNNGCYNSSGKLVLADDNLPFNTDGKCGKLCQSKNSPVGATTGSQECWCGDEYPPTENLVADSECNLPCTGFKDRACGGLDTWSVYNTGIKLAVHNSDPEKSATTTSPGSSSQTSSTSPAGSSAGSSESGSGSSKTIGIAVGVVAAVLIVGGGIGGLLWYLRKKRNQEIEEEHRRNAAVNAFINGSNTPGSSHGSISMTDSRLDPVMAHRRMSDGSIADNQDYSRKILRVTNA